MEQFKKLKEAGMSKREMILFVGRATKMFNKMCKPCRVLAVKDAQRNPSEYCENCQLVAEKYLGRWLK